MSFINKLFLDELINLCESHEAVPSPDGEYNVYRKIDNPIKYWNILLDYKHKSAQLGIKRAQYELDLIYRRCPVCEGKDGCSEECPRMKNIIAAEQDDIDNLSMYLDGGIVRIINVLKRENINSISQLKEMTRNSLLSIHGLGKRSYVYIKNALIKIKELE